MRGHGFCSEHPRGKVSRENKQQKRISERGREKRQVVKKLKITV